MKVSILVPEETASGAVTAPMDILNEAGRFKAELDNAMNSNFFQVELISKEGEYVKCMGGYPLRCHKSFEQVNKTDLIIVPNLTSDFENKIEQNKGFIQFIKEQHKLGAHIGAFCTGTLLLAATGLLNGKKATTHWMANDLFKRLFPKVNLLPEKIIVDEGSLICAGGSTSFMNLVIYLVEKYCGHETAVLLSKSMLIDMDKAPQSVYAIFSSQKAHGDKEISKVQNHIEENVDKQIKMQDLIAMTSLSARSFSRKFKKFTDNSPTEYIIRVKIEWARRKLEFESLTVQEISFALGYNDPNSFSRIFSKYIGISPSAYKKKFQRIKPIS